MNQKTLEELIADLKGFEPLAKATIGLDTGRMMKSATHLYFVAKRYGGWEVIEESLLSEVSKVEKKSNFLGDTYIFHTKSGRWTCKEVEDDIDLRQWMSRKGSVAKPSPTVQNTAIDEDINLSSVVEDSSNQDVEFEDVVPFAEAGYDGGELGKLASLSEDSLAEEIESTIEVLTQTFTPEQSHFDTLNTNRPQPGFNEADPLPDELQSVLKALTRSPPPVEEVSEPPLIEEDIPEVLTQFAQSKSVKGLDGLMTQNTIDKTEDSNSGCGSTIVKLLVFYWIFSSVFDVCS